ncbi:hypothetical protein EVAR_56635_1 [Eumeta japonica]|uniref:(+)RNA virus helicase C-terminal domain-containing protein n=1 Tax=Eumeta variegata TaxID=151549 RepID=A0A4C1XL55_EUMVA|nr:hypothetical protein EVAR_56635_1 [Eumeta japonica]
MSMSFETGEVVNRLECIIASKVHGIVDSLDSERLQQRKTEDKKAELEESSPSKGEIDPRTPVPVKRLRDHYVNVFTEYIALTSATLKVHKATCEEILELYQDKSEARLTIALEDVEAAIYDYDFQTILRGKMMHESRAEGANPRHGKTVTRPKTSDNAREDWVVPNITKDVVITTTREAAIADKEKLVSRLGADVNSKMKMMASVFVNDFRRPKSTDPLIVDEALMNHFGAIAMATGLAGLVIAAGKIHDVNIPKDLPNTLYLTYTQAKKESLIGFGKREGTGVLTTHKAQGLTSEETVIVRATAKWKLHDSVSYAVVEITRHAVSYVYYTEDGVDPIDRFIKRAVATSENKLGTRM